MGDGVGVGVGAGVGLGVEVAVDAGAEVAVDDGVGVAVGAGLAGAVGTEVDVMGVPEAAVGVDGAVGCSQARMAEFQAWPPCRQAT